MIGSGMQGSCACANQEQRAAWDRDCLTMPQDEERMRLSVADLTLTGHKQDAKFAVAISSAEPLVASGGEDAEVGLGTCSSVMTCQCMMCHSNH